MDMHDDDCLCLADDFSNERSLDLAMLPPRENADSLSHQDSGASYHMNEGTFAQKLAKLRL